MTTYTLFVYYNLWTYSQTQTGKKNKLTKWVTLTVNVCANIIVVGSSVSVILIEEICRQWAPCVSHSQKCCCLLSVLFQRHWVNGFELTLLKIVAVQQLVVLEYQAINHCCSADAWHSHKGHSISITLGSQVKSTPCFANFMFTYSIRCHHWLNLLISPRPSLIGQS